MYCCRFSVIVYVFSIYVCAPKHCVAGLVDDAVSGVASSCQLGGYVTAGDGEGRARAADRKPWRTSCVSSGWDPPQEGPFKDGTSME